MTGRPKFSIVLTIPDTESWPAFFFDISKKNDVNQSLVSLINDNY
jgi:hypothetical protein